MSDYTPTWFEIREQVEHNTYFTADEFDRMIDQERAEERERAAQIAESYLAGTAEGTDIAARIRAQGEETSA